MVLTYIFTKEIRPEHADQNGRLRLDTVFTVLQQAAETHAEKLGAGYDVLIRSDAAWVLTRMEVEMLDYPKMGEEITIMTTPGRMRAGLYPRYYELTGKDGRPVGRASSLWAVMNLSQRKMLSPADAPVCVPENLTYTPAAAMPGRVKKLDGPSVCRTHDCGYTDLDINRHVNNASYIRLLEDSFPHTRFDTQEIALVRIGYHSEIRAGEQVELTLTETGDEFYFTGGVEGRTCFAVSGIWRARANQI